MSINIKVLIVDDAFFMRNILKDILARPPYVIAGDARDGEEAITMYKSLRPDLTIMDIVLPRKDGITAMKEIMAFDKDAKIIICSAIGHASMITEALEAGAKDFIVKPFHPAKVLSVVASVMGTQAAAD
jgi:two-component system chemotaxis response regulator CheY